jgi:hypothetical protein
MRIADIPVSRIVASADAKNAVIGLFGGEFVGQDL